MIKKLLIGGASITASPWLTWADFLEFESRLITINLSHKGVGNEFIVNSLVRNQQHLGPDCLVVLMLTNIDKWDVFVRDERFDNLKDQKHAPIAVGPRSGFWCTGSWFPDYKQAYRDLYYDDDYFCCRTIQMIMLARSICQQQGSHLEILYDSDIWNFSEQDINRAISGPRPVSRSYLSADLSSMWAGQLNDLDLAADKQSLIGFCWNNHLPWSNLKYKGHPPSSSHWQFYRSVIRPRLSNLCDIRDSTQQMLAKIQEMDLLWQRS